MHRLASSMAAAAWLKARGVRSLCTDHRRVRPGDAFLAWPGWRHDARFHTSAAFAAGAVACLMEAEGLDDPSHPHDGLAASACDVTAPHALPPALATSLACLDDLKRQAGDVADAFLGHPSRGLQVVAVTGTNGKTSSTWWVAQALEALGTRCGVVGTLGVGEPQRSFESTGLTTPDAVALQASFRRFVDEGLQACAIEASSIGIVEHRLAGTSVAVAAFTNLTQDHLDYHGTMAAYGSAKRALFDTPGLKAAVLNVDDAHGRAWAAELARRCDLALWTVSAAGAEGGRDEAGTAPSPRLWARQVQHIADGMALALCERDAVSGAERQEFLRTPLIGGFNVENLVVVAGCLRALGHPLAQVAQALGGLTPVPGRLERVPAAGPAPQPAVVVDYAHTPDALDKALQALAPLASARGGRLWCVFGCGGDRDAAKRPLMGRVAVQGAPHVVVTSDNPRSEPPGSILAQVMAGARQATHCGVAARSLVALEDRRAAIEHAVQAAQPADVVLIAGKGHEQTQEIAGVKHPFSDVDEALAALARRLSARRAGDTPGSAGPAAMAVPQAHGLNGEPRT
ncbi:MAG: UDP-N-acetylmuramoyl-L-alanyl-D-glutamate--2,6-diaminopimelate ligase [Rubrivivax sp.]